jgi:DNA-binding CsgD family transcriptional regulator
VPRQSAAARHDRLIERDVEIGEIDRALAGAGMGEGWLLAFEGPAGIGKTALLGAAREQAEHAGVSVLFARGGELEGGFPYGVVRQLFEPALHAADRSRRERLLMGAAALAAPAVLGPAVATAEPADPSFAVVHGLYWLVANLAAEAPLALVVDDVHWSDEPSLRFLIYLARRLEGLAVTVIASIRSGEPGSARGSVSELVHSPGAHLSLPATLSETAVGSMLATAFERSPETDFVRACHRATGGNPFLVGELAATLIADGIEPTADMASRLTSTGSRSVARATLVRLGHISEHAAELARAIAVLGGDASLSRAASLAELDEPAALDALDVLVAADIVSTSGALEFVHPLVRTAIYGELTLGTHSEAHRRAAELLAGEGADLDAVAGHLLATEPIGSRRTIDTLQDAAAHALTLGAPDSAGTYLSRALDEGCERSLRTTLLLELALAEKLARQPSATTRFAEVCRLAEDPVTRARAMIEQADMFAYAGDRQTAQALLDDALEELAEHDPVLGARAEALNAALMSSDPRLFGGLTKRWPALRELVATGGRETRALAMVLAGTCGQQRESTEQMVELAEQGWDSGRYLEDGESIEVLPQGICALVVADRLDIAGEMVDAVARTAQASGSVLHYLVASAHRAFIETRRGDLVAAAGEMRGCFERALELGMQFAAVVTLWYCADVLLELPEVADLAALALAIELGPTAEIQPGAMTMEVRGRLLLAGGDRAGAIDCLRRVAEINSALSIVDPNESAWRSTLALALPAENRVEALELAASELSDARRVGQPRGIGTALRVLGNLEGGDAGRPRLEEAVNVLASSPARLEHARALIDLGAALRRQGSRVAAREPLREGLDLAMRCGAERLSEHARTELSATGARPRRLFNSGRDALTPSELRVARMAAEGLTSQEIAQALFVTTKTVDSHLGHAYTKLGINSRKQLADALGQAAARAAR